MCITDFHYTAGAHVSPTTNKNTQLSLHLFKRLFILHGRKSVTGRPSYTDSQASFDIQLKNTCIFMMKHCVLLHTHTTKELHNYSHHKQRVTF